jgi:hypothetical protein
MKTDKQIIDAMILQDELHELREMHHKLSQKALKYGWCDFTVKDYL